MKLRIVLVLVLMFALSLSFNYSFAQVKKSDLKKIVGTWEMESEGRNGEMRKYEWVFSADDGNLTAKIPMRRRGGEGSAKRDIENVKFDGDNLGFTLEFEGRNGTRKLEYTAKVEDGKMTGSRKMGERAREFSGKMAKSAGSESKEESGKVRFTKHVEVLGAHIYATNTTSDEKLLHAAGVLAQYLDNDEDGKADNQKIMDALMKRSGTIAMTNTQAERRLIPRNERPRGQGLYAEETIPNYRKTDRFDGALEEILHMITDNGWGGAYPEVFGRDPGTEISDAMDNARGGQFIKTPKEYPEGAWYSYDDETCNYDCMNSEYIYWAFTSILGAQDYPGRLDVIGREWKLNTRKLVKEKDPTVFALMTNPEYKLPTKLPDGNYKGQKLVIKPYKQ